MKLSHIDFFRKLSNFREGLNINCTVFAVKTPYKDLYIDCHMYIQTSGFGTQVEKLWNDCEMCWSLSEIYIHERNDIPPLKNLKSYVAKSLIERVDGTEGRAISFPDPQPARRYRILQVWAPDAAPSSQRRESLNVFHNHRTWYQPRTMALFDVLCGVQCRYHIHIQENVDELSRRLPNKRSKSCVTMLLFSLDMAKTKGKQFKGINPTQAHTHRQNVCSRSSCLLVNLLVIGRCAQKCLNMTSWVRSPLCVNHGIQNRNVIIAVIAGRSDWSLLVQDWMACLHPPALTTEKNTCVNPLEIGVDPHTDTHTHTD